MVAKITEGMTPEMALAKIRSDFNLKFKNKILGQTDLVFSNVVALTTNDQERAAIRSRRTRMASEIRSLETTEPDPLARKMLVAEKQMAFAQYALSIAKKYSSKASASTMANVINTLSDELDDAVAMYVEGRGGVENIDTGNSRDADFMQKADKMRDALASLSTPLKSRLVKEKVFFSVPLNEAKKDLANAGSTIDLFV